MGRCQGLSFSSCSIGEDRSTEQEATDNRGNAALFSLLPPVQFWFDCPWDSDGQLDLLLRQVRELVADRLDFIPKEFVYLLRRPADELRRLDDARPVNASKGMVRFQP